MRDPDAVIEIAGSRVQRRFTTPLANGDFLRSSLCADLMERGQIVPFEEVSPVLLSSPLWPFVSTPMEWSDSQFHDAAALTLDIQRESNRGGFDLKDGSAWNVIFTGTLPVFCDHASFIRLRTERWWAAGQFARHFLLPLWLSRARGMNARFAFHLSRDGVSPETARDMLGLKRFFHRCVPLLFGGSREGAEFRVGESSAGAESLLGFRARLNATLDWMLEGVKPKRAPHSTRESGWVSYQIARTHYGESGVAFKRIQVSGWISALKPDRVLDLGSNTGEFAMMAAELGAVVVAVDQDHDSMEELYRRARPSKLIHPVIAKLDDLHGGGGWWSREHPGLPSRLSSGFDMVLMLALIHHLAIGASIPLRSIASMVAACTRRWLIVEWIGAADPQLRLLCDQRSRASTELTMASQREAFVAEGFFVEVEIPIPSTHRTLALLRKA